jgi:hypothetical protein
MILLPVKLYDKCIQVLFNIDFKNDNIIIKPNNNDNIYEIVLCSASYGINTIPICFPLNFIIIKDELLCDHFYIFNTLSSKNNMDFLNLLLIEINKIKNTSYKYYNNTNINNLITILKLNNNDTSEDNITTIIHSCYYRIIRYINFCFAIMLNNVNNVSATSKILQIINIIKQIKILFYGNYTTVEEHIEFIENIDNKSIVIKKKRNYFYEKNNKLLKVYIDNKINSNNILTPYPCKFKNHIKMNNLLNILIINHFHLLFEVASKVLYKKKPYITNLMINIINNNKDGYIDILKDNDLVLCIATNISFNKFKELTLTFDEKLWTELINNYTYPINYDKKTLNEHFAKILYYSLKFSDNILNINFNHKLKIILLFLIKLYKSFINNELNLIYYSKLYTDIILYQIIKILLFNDTFNIFNISNSNLSIIKHKFISNIMILHILNNLSWNTISKQLPAFKYVVGLKDTCYDLIMIDGKLNKHHTCNMDNRLKKIIIDPILMFNYLKKEEDFYIWIISFKEHIMKIFNNMIAIDNNDYLNLSKILYYYSKINNQNLQDSYYKKLLNISKFNPKLILFNDRINIKFKDIFKNKNINLGFMARDIMIDDNFNISISEDTTDNETISKLKRKYYKYKGKYLEMKYTDTILDSYKH